MKFVENREFYHINTIDTKNKSYLRDSQKFVVGENYNPYYSAFEYGYGLLKNNTETLLRTVTLYWHFALETIFEEERIKINPELPSRKRCLWLADENSLLYWKNQLNTQAKKSQITTLKVTGKIFKCDPSWVELQPMPLIEVRKNAQQYWNGVMKDENKIEYLFEGEVEVTSIIGY